MGFRDEIIKMKTPKKIYERIQSEIIIDENGTVIQENTKCDSLVKSSPEPEFIKIYYQTMLAFNDIEGIPLNYLLSLSKFIEWANPDTPMFVTINKRVKDEISKDCNISISHLDRHIRNSVNFGILFKTEYRAVYEVNPFMIAKGKWESIKNLQCRFSYVNGKWERISTFKELELKDKSTESEEKTND